MSVGQQLHLLCEGDVGEIFKSAIFVDWVFDFEKPKYSNKKKIITYGCRQRHDRRTM